MRMRKWILLIGFCCIASLTNAQEFIIDKITSKYIEGIHVHVNARELYYGEPPEKHILRFISSNKAERMAAYDRLREEWMKSKKSEVLTPALDSLLSDTTLLNKTFNIFIYFNRDGSVFTVYFIISEDIYDRLPAEWVKDMYNRLMKEQVEATKFWNFSAMGEDALGKFGISVTDLKKGIIRPQELSSIERISAEKRKEKAN